VEGGRNRVRAKSARRRRGGGQWLVTTDCPLIPCKALTSFNLKSLRVLNEISIKYDNGVNFSPADAAVYSVKLDK
jgi:hypothetical protein